MIVLDASAVAARRERLIVPHLLDIEVISAIRNLSRGSRLDSFRTAQLLADLAALPAERRGHRAPVALFARA